MKYLLSCFWFCLTSISAITATAQVTQDATRQIQIYEDDDYFNVWGRGTDRAYSNGTGLGYIYMKNKKSTFLDKILLHQAGADAINVFEWDLMQIMITPNEIADTSYQPKDFYYAGALFATHALNSYNPIKKYSFRTEIVFGVMGPWSFTKEAQTFFHKLISYQPPRGWENQVPNSPLLNYNFTFEVMLWNPLKSLEIIGGLDGKAGTMTTSGSVYTYFRYGLMNPYFGDINLARGTKRRFQLYVIARPQVSVIAYNALLQGGIFRSTSSNFEELSGEQRTHMRNFTIGMDYGIGIVIKRTTISYTQKTQTEWMSGTGKHSVGNITLLIPISRKTIPEK
ncbi:lipid A deacylase LpxR family protein [Chitinophaga silvatica]|uniref:Lipid A deacylase LpxR family protein n=1 Tax=Chitinophaga silvatica TaxID=2282649 RepID=A0A3E1YB81_9BACT|nr:lipid A deacylase LpxR family protein [Chitinophaga silvatica]RFS23261.1 lipid A deacylase LpxR family protein [Chitinophaga silvatica]